MESVKELKENMLYKLSKKMNFYKIVMEFCVVVVLFIFSLGVLLVILYLSIGIIFIGVMFFLVVSSVSSMCIALLSCARNSIVCKKIMCVMNNK